VPSDADRLSAELAALEDELERARERLRHGEEQLASLEELRAAAAGSVNLARRAIDEIEERADERRRVLAEIAALEEERRAFAGVVAERDAAGTQLAATANRLLAELDVLVAAREAVVEAQRAALRRGRTVEEFRVPDEAGEVHAAWSSLVARVREAIEQTLEDELVTAAARSVMGADIKNLPVHLQAAARARRTLLRRDAAARRDNPDA